MEMDQQPRADGGNLADKARLTRLEEEDGGRPGQSVRASASRRRCAAAACHQAAEQRFR